jgi:hypothetical protein
LNWRELSYDIHSVTNDVFIRAEGERLLYILAERENEEKQNESESTDGSST